MEWVLDRTGNGGDERPGGEPFNGWVNGWRRGGEGQKKGELEGTCLKKTKHKERMRPRQNQSPSLDLQERNNRNCPETGREQKIMTPRRRQTKLGFGVIESVSTYQVQWFKKGNGDCDRSQDRLPALVDGERSREKGPIFLLRQEKECGEEAEGVPGALVMIT